MGKRIAVVVLLLAGLGLVVGGATVLFTRMDAYQEHYGNVYRCNSPFRGAEDRYDNKVAVQCPIVRAEGRVTGIISISLGASLIVASGVVGMLKPPRGAATSNAGIAGRPTAGGPFASGPPGPPPPHFPQS